MKNIVSVAITHIVTEEVTDSTFGHTGMAACYEVEDEDSSHQFWLTSSDMLLDSKMSVVMAFTSDGNIDVKTLFNAGLTSDGINPKNVAAAMAILTHSKANPRERFMDLDGRIREVASTVWKHWTNSGKGMDFDTMVATKRTAILIATDAFKHGVHEAHWISECYTHLGQPRGIVSMAA